MIRARKLILESHLDTLETLSEEEKPIYVEFMLWCDSMLAARLPYPSYSVFLAMGGKKYAVEEIERKRIKKILPNPF